MSKLENREVIPNPKPKSRPRTPKAKRRNLGPWRARVLRRDRGKCVMCGYQGMHVSAHHLIHLKHCEERYEDDVRNGMTLCNAFAPNRCHTELHELRLKIPLVKLGRDQVECMNEQGLRWEVGDSGELEPQGKLAKYFC